MTISFIAGKIDGTIICGHNKVNDKVEFAFASDLMSDVLTLQSSNLVLITGLCNLQTIRTAEFSDINCVIIARNKKVSPEMIELANENGLVVIECKSSVFKTSGVLYGAGIKPVY